jgi:predicted house-cleaning noncanonical NTP pyrophosphatase (MazG superfamily)
MKPSKTDAIKKYMQKKRICQRPEIMVKFALGHGAVKANFNKLGTLTSFNCKGQYYILPEEHSFDESGLLFIGDAGFFKGGNLLAAICHLVEISDSGLGARELDKMLKTSTHSQLPKLYRSGRLQRELAGDRAGHGYIYFSLEKTRFEAQHAAYFSVKEEVQDVVEAEEIVPEELPDVVEVLLTLISHPDFSAKSIALSLQRRGRKVSFDFVQRTFLQYGLSKKNS